RRGRAVTRRRTRRTGAVRVGGTQLRRDRERARGASRYRAVATQSGAVESARTASADRERTVSNDFDPLRALRPDRVLPDDPAEPTVFARQKEKLMPTISETSDEPTRVLPMPDIYPRLAYEDERAALDYLQRVFQLEEIREARTENEQSLMAWLRVGNGVVM